MLAEMKGVAHLHGCAISSSQGVSEHNSSEEEKSVQATGMTETSAPVLIKNRWAERSS